MNRQERLAEERIRKAERRRAALDVAKKSPKWQVVVPFRDPKQGADRVHKNVRRGG